MTDAHILRLWMSQVNTCPKKRGKTWHTDFMVDGQPKIRASRFPVELPRATGAQHLQLGDLQSEGLITLWLLALLAFPFLHLRPG